LVVGGGGRGVAREIVQPLHPTQKNNDLIIIIITLFKSRIILAEHECSSNWGDCKSNQ